MASYNFMFFPHSCAFTLTPLPALNRHGVGEPYGWQFNDGDTMTINWEGGDQYSIATLHFTGTHSRKAPIVGYEAVNDVPVGKNQTLTIKQENPGARWSFDFTFDGKTIDPEMHIGTGTSS